MRKTSEVKDVCVLHMYVSECVLREKSFRERDAVEKKDEKWKVT